MGALFYCLFWALLCGAKKCEGYRTFFVFFRHGTQNFIPYFCFLSQNIVVFFPISGNYEYAASDKGTHFFVRRPQRDTFRAKSPQALCPNGSVL